MTFETERVSLGDVVRRERGSIRTGPFGTTLRASEYSEVGFPVVSVGEIGYGSFRIHKETRRIGPEVLKRLPIYRLNVGDIVFARKGAVDRCATVRDAEDGWFLGSDGIRIRFGRGSGQINPIYLGYALHASDVRRWLLRNATGTTMATLNQDLLERVPVWVPERDEQDRIASALDDVSSLVTGLETLIAKKRDVKQGMMQDLLTGRTRLPGFTGDWCIQNLRDATTVDPDSLSPLTTPRTEEIDYIALEDVSRGVILGSTRIEFGVAPSRARRAIRDGDVLFGTVRPNLQSHGIYRGGLGNPVVSTGFAVIRYKDGLSDSNYLAQWVLSDVVMSQVDRIIAGSNYPAVSSADVRAFEIHLPTTIDEQRAIGQVLADADAEIETLERRLQSARAVKVGMMQELLTGRTRLPVGEDA